LRYIARDAFHLPLVAALLFVRPGVVELGGVQVCYGWRQVEYKINEGQAEIIREIFRRYAAGDGLRTIVKDLNARRVPSPSVGKRGSGHWVHTAAFLEHPPPEPGSVR
jgi:hypothetical protein